MLFIAAAASITAITLRHDYATPPPIFATPAAAAMPLFRCRHAISRRHAIFDKYADADSRRFRRWRCHYAASPLPMPPIRRR